MQDAFVKVQQHEFIYSMIFNDPPSLLHYLLNRWSLAGWTGITMSSPPFQKATLGTLKSKMGRLSRRIDSASGLRGFMQSIVHMHLAREVGCWMMLAWCSFVRLGFSSWLLKRRQCLFGVTFCHVCILVCESLCVGYLLVLQRNKTRLGLGLLSNCVHIFIFYWHDRWQIYSIPIKTTLYKSEAFQCFKHRYKWKSLQGHNSSHIFRLNKKNNNFVALSRNSRHLPAEEIF